MATWFRAQCASQRPTRHRQNHSNDNKGDQPVGHVKRGDRHQHADNKAGAIPALYSLVTPINTLVFAWTRNLNIYRFVQLLMFLLLKVKGADAMEVWHVLGRKAA
jgi:hypothetical protein